MDDKKPGDKADEAPKEDDETRKQAYFDKLRAQTEAYLDKIKKRYEKRVQPDHWIFRITGGLVILCSVSLPFLAQMTTAEHKAPTSLPPAVISLVSLLVALLTALNSFFGWRFSWQRGVAVLGALEHYTVCWKMDLLKAEEEEYPKAKVDAYLHTSYLYTQVFAAVSAESEAFFAQLSPLPQEPEKHKTSSTVPAGTVAEAEHQGSHKPQ